jgi:heme/copper-type cytochrome/quinol oxidase subunit 2
MALGAAVPTLAADGDTITIAREHLTLLQEQTREHREFLEFIYTIWTALLGAVVLGVVGLFTFFNVKTRKDVEHIVEREIHSSVSETFKHRVEAPIFRLR